MSLEQTPGPDRRHRPSADASSAIDLKAVRAKLQKPGAPDVWRSLEEVAGTPEFKDYLHREFPSNASEWLDPVGRRNFLKLMSASMALAGVTACTRAARRADRSVRASARRRDSRQAAVLRDRDDARRRRHRACSSKATKAVRPRSKATPIIPRARAPPTCSRRVRSSTLYDPDRSQTMTQLGDIRPWSAVIAAIRGGLSAQAASKGAGLRILTETVASPTLAAQIQQVLARSPARSGSSGNRSIATTRAPARARRSASTSSRCLRPRPRPTSSSRSMPTSSSSDGAANLHYMRQFASRRRVEDERRQPQSPLRGRSRSRPSPAARPITACRSSRARSKRSRARSPRAPASAASRGTAPAGVGRVRDRPSPRICRTTRAAPSSSPAMRSRPRCTPSRTRSTPRSARR